MHGKLYNPIQSLITLLLAQAYVGVTSLPTSSTAVNYDDVENVIRTGLTSQFTHGFDRLQVLVSPWSPRIKIRSITQTMDESHSQSPLKPRECIGDAERVLTAGCGDLVPGSITPYQAQVHSATSEVATSEQPSSLNIPLATPPPVAVTLTTSNDNAAKPTKPPGNAVAVPVAEPVQHDTFSSAVNSHNVDPVRSSQISTVPQKSTTHPYERSMDIPNATDLVPAPGKPQSASNSRGATSPALSAASEEVTLLGMSMISRTSLSPTSERALAVPGTDRPSMPPTSIPTTAPTIHNTQPASQSIGKGRPLSSSHTARDFGAISSINNGTSGQKSSMAANTTANVTTLSQTSLRISSTSIVANSTTVSFKSTTASQITSSSVFLFSPVSTTTTSQTTTTSSSSASVLRFKEAGSHPRVFSMIRLLGYLAGCMMVGARVLA